MKICGTAIFVFLRFLHNIVIFHFHLSLRHFYQIFMLISTFFFYFTTFSSLLNRYNCHIFILNFRNKMPSNFLSNKIFYAYQHKYKAFSYIVTVHCGLNIVTVICFSFHFSSYKISYFIFL